jgi:hypothetical protein
MTPEVSMEPNNRILTGRRALLALRAPAIIDMRHAEAQEVWPDRPVRLLVPYSTGGSTDLVARLVADMMSQRLPQRVIVENRTGRRHHRGHRRRAVPAGWDYSRSSPMSAMSRAGSSIRVSNSTATTT